MMRTYPRKKKKRPIIAGLAAPAGRTARPYPPNTNFWEALCRKATKGNRYPEENDRKPPPHPTPTPRRSSIENDAVRAAAAQPAASKPQTQAAPFPPH